MTDLVTSILGVSGGKPPFRRGTAVAPTRPTATGGANQEPRKEGTASPSNAHTKTIGAGGDFFIRTLDADEVAECDARESIVLKSTS
jgi:hypothetical protein